MLGEIERIKQNIGVPKITIGTTNVRRLMLARRRGAENTRAYPANAW